MNNFRCPKTGAEFFITKYSLKIRSGGTIYVDKDGNELINPENGEKLVHIEKGGTYSVSNVSGSKEQKVKMKNWMRARSKNHFKKEIKDYKEELVKKSIPGQ